jgi:pimeloyl-ACP methyl ester carboxylesterase
MISERRIETARLGTRLLEGGAPDGVPVIFVHGNLASADWWRGTMARLPKGFRALAPDLRAYGGADPAAKVDATRGMRDFSDDLAALMDALAIPAAHLVGHSLGGSVLWQFMADHPGRALSVTQVCPGSPYGFGGCRPDGTPCAPDNAGSGGGAVNPEFARLLAAGARGADTPFHPLSILNAYVWKPPFVPAEIDLILSATLAQHLGAQDYPGDSRPSPHWPGVAPGVWGPINAMAPAYQSDPLGFHRADGPVLWIRGADDPVVSDASLFDLGMLGQLGAVPGWPGPDAFPPQPMIAQTARALDGYAALGRRVERVVLPDCGHSPFLEKPAAFDAAFHRFLAG